jgi:inorganic pyrophosphatase/exopolyphosphatase
MQKIIITAGAKGADIDVLACAVAYAELLRLEGKEALAVVQGSFTMSVTPSILSWNGEFQTEYKDTNDQDHFVLVDISDPEHFPSFVDIERVSEVYDHRFGHEDFWQAKIQQNSHIEMVGACGTLIWEEFQKRGKQEEITMTSAKLLLASIVSNTLNFQGPIATERDRKAYSELKAITGLDEQWVAEYFVEQEQVLLNDFKTSLKTDTKVFKTTFGDFVIGQIELWDAEMIIKNKTKEISEVMEGYSQPWILNAPNISKGYNYIYSTNERAKKIIEDNLHIVFSDDFAKTEKLMMRKEIMKILFSI